MRSRLLGRRARRTLGGALIAAVSALGIAVGVPAVGDEVSPDRAQMVVRPAAPDAFALSIRTADGVIRGVTLSCKPIGGNHPAARAACAQLTAARGEVSRIPARPGVCTMQYDPVTLTANGTWHAQPRSYTRTFSNRCVAVRDTGGILFDF